MSTALTLAEQVEDLRARLTRVIQIGRIAHVDYATALARVAVAETLTAPRPWLTRRACSDRDWWAPEVGEQVLLLAPSGDLTASVILPALYRDGAPEPADRATVHTVHYADGAAITYDRETHALTAALPEGGSVTIDAPAAVSVNTRDAVLAAETVLVRSGSIDLAGSGGPAVARVGDLVAVGAGSSAGRWPIVTGSTQVRAG